MEFHVDSGQLLLISENILVLLNKPPSNSNPLERWPTWGLGGSSHLELLVIMITKNNIKRVISRFLNVNVFMSFKDPRFCVSH